MSFYSYKSLNSYNCLGRGVLATMAIEPVYTVIVGGL